MALTGKRIGLLTASASRLGGGVFEAVVQQAALIAGLGGDPVVIALDDMHAATDRARFPGMAVHHVPIAGPRQIGFAPALNATLAAAKLDLLHLHGIWMYPSHAGAKWAAATCRPYIISPHGMLDPWIVDRGRWKKRLARWGYERGSWARATLFHSLTEDEAIDIVFQTGRKTAVVVPNAAPPCGAARRDGTGALYLGRIHPKKNLHTLVEAWLNAVPGDTLTIAGWGDPADVAALKAVITAAGPAVRFVGAVHGATKDALLGAARWLVLPSLSEGLPMVVLEAWAAGTPTIMTPACHLAEGFAAGAALPCGDTTEALAPVLRAAMAMPDEAWRTHSEAARSLARGTFSPDTVAARWEAIYTQALV